MKFFIKKLFILPIGLFCVSLHGNKVIDPVSAFIDANLHDSRNTGFHRVIQRLQRLNAKVIVETGTSRGGCNAFLGDGGFTIIFGLWAALNKAHVYSVDICEKAVESARGMVKAYADFVTLACDDSVHYLQEFPKQIDFLYLDSFDYDKNDPIPSQMHHVKEIQAAYDKLHKDTVIMIDDCALPGGGKGKLVIDYLLKNDWQIIYNNYQVILIYKGDNLPAKEA